MSLLGDWQASRERRRRAEKYLKTAVAGGDVGEHAWSSGLPISRDVLSREVVFARRALALIVAERDALDDQTAADVTHALTPLLDDEARRSPEVGRLWQARWRAYAAALAVRGQAEVPTVRLARVLLEGAGVAQPTAEVLAAATQFVQLTRSAANESLRAAFGVASLPEDIRPSALRP